MLVDIGTNYEGQLHRLNTGLYLMLDALAEHNVLRDDWYVFDHEWPEFQGDVESRLKMLRERFETNTWFNDYGSCDSPEQFMEHEYGRLLTSSPHQFVVLFHYMTQEDYGGRRWHKNGPHIGLKEPQYEHFADETEIKEIYSFHIYRKKVT